MKVLFMGCLLAVTRLAEVQSCLPLPEDIVGKNLALKKPAKHSSRNADPYRGPPDRAVDGNCNAVFAEGSCSHTNSNKNPWWMVDLGQSYKIYAVVVKNRHDCCHQRLYEAEIHVGDSLKDNGRVNYLCDIIQNDNPGSINTLYCEGHQGRYVSVHIPRVEYLTLCEVEVYAVP